MIRFDNVSKRYPSGQEALRELTFELAQGEMAFVTGHSGAGKSTLLKMIALLDRPTRGQVHVNGQNLAQARRRAIPQLRRRIGMVFQDHRLLMDRTVYDNVALPLIIAGVAREEIGKRVRASLDKVGLLGREADAPVALSTGEQQRVGIARAIVAKPPVLIADEPTGNLDPQLSAEIMTLFGAFQQVGTTVLIASHDLALIKRMGKRVLVLNHGKLIDDFRPHS
jgi:cell division transport system ATP-binding protein